MMKINTKMIKNLNPCKDRYKNFVKNYSYYSGYLKDFILLENITYGDKVWVVTRLFNREQNVKWSIICASKVLSIFEEKYPEDKRPRLALEAAEKWLLNPSEDNRNAAFAAANSAANAASAAYSDIYSAANAAYSAAFAANSAAANSTGYAASAAASAAHAAAYAAAHAAAADSDYYTDESRTIEEQVNLLFMIEAENE